MLIDFNTDFPCLPKASLLVANQRIERCDVLLLACEAILGVVVETNA
jgi:hypothetical protein